jgi:hypothetical protein
MWRATGIMEHGGEKNTTRNAGGAVAYVNMVGARSSLRSRRHYMWHSRTQKVQCKRCGAAVYVKHSRRKDTTRNEEAVINEHKLGTEE